MLPAVDETRVGDWIQTWHGGSFWPLDPRADEIEVHDIAHSLSMLCRYNGHCSRFYSVAEHSILVSQSVPPRFALWGLLHDAAEAYTSDIPRPLKRNLPDWKPIEAKIMLAVCEKFGLDPEEPAEVKYADTAICADEKTAVMHRCDRDWGPLPPPLGAIIVGMNPTEAENEFMKRFEELTSRATTNRLPRYKLPSTSLTPDW